MAYKTHFKVEVLAMDTINNENSIGEVSNHRLTRDKVKRYIVPFQRFNYVGLGCYALNFAEVLLTLET